VRAEEGCVLSSKQLVKKGAFIGDGPVKYRLDAPIAGDATTLTLQIDYADVPVPKFYYLADYVHVKSLDSSVLLVFGKWDDLEAKDKLRTKLEIYFPGVSFVNHLWGTSRDFHVALRAAVSKFGFEPNEPSPLSIRAEKAQTITSNIVLMALSGFDSLIDFYYLSPRELFTKASRGRPNIELEPLARVILPPPMLLGFLNSCESIAQSLSERFLLNEKEEEAHDNLESN